MSDTIIDMAKVTQMLDAGWGVRLYRGGMGSYVAVGVHGNWKVMKRLEKFVDEDGEVTTDDFTPEQALTRLAYKVHGEII